ncbi:MAG: dNTP triphosphohydrolase [Acidobacteria bacterium]|nr:dNTP triphosphohydrolase [Acidobacteriota bacterium]
MFLKRFLEDENHRLAPIATRSDESRRRHEEPVLKVEYRTPFQHDRDRIIHCLAFKRMKEKTQVFAPEQSDHLRNRLSHTLEVTQLSRSVARALALNEDLAEAISLGHDLGHSPFGHSGEAVLNRILKQEIPIDNADSAAFRQAGGFKHNYQSVRIVDELENRYRDWDGLNLTDKVREGILKHTGTGGKLYNLMTYEGLQVEHPATTPEAAIVAMTDEIAQQCHDLEDGIRLKLAFISQLKETAVYDIEPFRAVIARGDSYDVMNDLIRTLFHVFMDDLIGNGVEQGKNGQFRFAFSPELEKAFAGLRNFVYTRIIFSHDVARSDHVAKRVLRDLFNAFYNSPKLLPDYVLNRVSKYSDVPNLRRLTGEEQKKTADKLKSCDKFIRVIADYIGGMTDSYAMKEYRKINP